MPLTEPEIRQQAWNRAVDATGTLAVFDRRAKRLRLLTDARDYFGFIALPGCTAFVGTTEFISATSPYRHLALAMLAGAVLIQALLAGWSLVRQWDEQRGYCIRAIRDSYEMKQAWEDIAKCDVEDLQSAYQLRKEQQRIIDSHDIERGISDAEKRRGMRAGLFEYRRACAKCNREPSSRVPPFFAYQRCQVCGGGK
jgi:mobilome CxxCx(11)CxxC protein